MKKVFLLSLLFFPALAFSQEQEAVLKDLSGGVYSYPSPNQIPDNAAAYIQNFYTDVEPLAQERNGYTKRDSTVLGGTKAVYGLWEFVDATGSDWIISYSSRTFYKNILGGTPTPFGLVATVDQIPDCAKNLGVIMCVNGTDAAWAFDGTSTITISGAPLGTLIEPWRNRFAIANINGAKSTIRFSADGSTSTWTIGGNPTDPFAISVGGANDGEYVRCLVGSYLDSLIAGRKYDLWALDGFDQDDVVLRNVSVNVGCIEPRTPQEVDGELVFMSARGLEAMSGRTIRNISEPVRNITDIITKNTVSQRTASLTTANDWGSGTFDSTVNVDTETVSGRLAFTFPDNFSSLRNGTSATKKVWQTYRTTGDIGSAAGVNGGLLELTPSGTFWSMLRTVVPINQLRQGTTIQITFNSLPGSAANDLGRAGVMLSTTVLSGYQDFSLGPTSQFQAWHYIFQTSGTVGFPVSGYAATNGTGVNGFDTVSITTQIATPFVFSLYIATSIYSVSINGIPIRSGAHTWPSVGWPMYLYLGSRTSIVGKLDDFSVAPQTFTYTSPAVFTSSAITTWGPASADLGNASGGAAFFQVGSTNNANISNISNYTSIANGGVPTIATNTYAGMKVTMYGTNTLLPLYMDAYTFSWNEGGIVPSPVAGVSERRYWLSYTTAATSSPTLDAVLVWQRNKSFTLLKGINAGSFSFWRDNFYFGNSNNTGYVYKTDDDNSDDGADIVSVINTKSYDLDTSYRDKSFRNSFIQFLANSAFTGSFAASYSVDQAVGTYNLGSASMSEGDGRLAIKFPFSFNNPTRGREIQYKIVKSGTGQRLKLYDIVLKYTVEEEN